MLLAGGALRVVVASPAGAGRAQETAQALVERALANQHRNDAALAEYERLERRRVRKDGSVAEDKTRRVVPTGTGTLRLVVEENGRPVAADFYRKQLRDLEQALVWALNPQESKQRQRVEKWEKRKKERASSVDAVREAFLITPLGESATCPERSRRAAGPGGRRQVRIQLDPNPAFKPRTRTAELFPYVRATLWVDQASGQLERLEAESIRDISIGGGLLGKIYRGGRFVIEQREAAPGVWLPTLYQTDITGRRFLFSFELHESTEVRNYVHIGPPQEALAAVRRELASPQASAPESSLRK